MISNQDHRSVSRRSGLHAICLSILVLGSVCFVLGQTPLDNNLQDDLARLESLRSAKDLDLAEKAILSASEKWKQKSKQDYIAYMLAACGSISSYDWGNESKQALVLTRLATLVLNGNNLTIPDEAQFVGFLNLDPIVLPVEEWAVLRSEKSKLWLSAWKRVVDGVDPAFNPRDMPLLNVPLPPGSGLPAGVAPESIPDPERRRQYEAAISANNAKARKYNEQQWLKQNGPGFLKSAERYIVNAYSRPPDDLPGLERLLAQYVADSDTRQRIVEAVRKRQ